MRNMIRIKELELPMDEYLLAFFQPLRFCPNLSHNP